jgi:hypothetical protein
LIGEEVDEKLFSDFETFAINKVIDGHDPIACAMIMVTLGISACKIALDQKDQDYLLNTIKDYMTSNTNVRKKLTLH